MKVLLARLIIIIGVGFIFFDIGLDIAKTYSKHGFLASTIAYMIIAVILYTIIKLLTWAFDNLNF